MLQIYKKYWRGEAAVPIFFIGNYFLSFVMVVQKDIMEQGIEKSFTNL